ncbi:MAG: histidine phosphatase family protein [Chloroflexi bacterium]|nr:MAG: histidine phosphatase family protein [Chloroflexota bacterium]
MKIYLSRHGQSRWQVSINEEGLDSPLTELGQNQAQYLANWLANDAALNNGTRVDVAHLRVSPLIRAQQTAVPIAEMLGATAVTDKTLRETDFHIEPQLPTVVSPYQNHIPYTPTNEYAAFKEQAQAALLTLVAAAEFHNGSVLAVTHGGLISTILRMIVGTDAISFQICNASLNLIEWKGGRWHLVHLNLWDHLPTAMRTF